MSWTTPADIRAQMDKLWRRGELLSALVRGDQRFPRRLALKGPSSNELSERYADVRNWIERLRRGESQGYRIVWRDVRHRVLGQNAVPDEIWIDSAELAFALIGKGAESRRFLNLLEMTGRHHPRLLPWLARRPLKALALNDEWPRLLDIVSWLGDHPRPGIYLRQIDLPGIDTKFIEQHRAILTELLDLALPPEAIRTELTGSANFCSRYGFRDKPARLRFRVLDPDLTIFPTGADQDIAVSHDAFARLDLPIERVFITENEINFLAFPSVPKGIVIFGAGYGFDRLSEARWLESRRIHYWGDIDTHGFAILDQLRSKVPHAESFLMDRETLLAHRVHWGRETTPQKRDLSRLNPIENRLYDDLRYDRINSRLRLEQEKVEFEWIKGALEGLLP